jgi:predicted membrane chloride channel (bestrophin family)
MRWSIHQGWRRTCADNLTERRKEWTEVMRRRRQRYRTVWHIVSSDAEQDGLCSILLAGSLCIRTFLRVLDARSGPAEGSLFLCLIVYVAVR